MGSSRLFWKLFASAVAVNVGACLVLGLVVSIWERRIILDQVRDQLHASAIVLKASSSDLLKKKSQNELMDLASRIGTDTQTRVTLIAPDGQILADSQEEFEPGDNQLGQPEVKTALAQGSGFAEREVPAAGGKDMLFAALRVDGPDGPVGFVRTALPASIVQAPLARANRRIWSVAAALAAVGLIGSYVVSSNITTRLAGLAQGADAIAEGQFDQSVPVTRRDELGSLGESFNRMSARLATRIAELERGSERLATVLGSMIEGVIAVDADQRILFANDAAQSLLEFPTGEAAGRPLWEIVRIRAVQQVALDAFEAPSPCGSECETVGKTRRVVAIHATRLPGSPCPGVVLVLHDVTELRRLENLRQEFVANVSHELKTPLTAIKAYAETLLNGALGDAEHNVSFVKRIEEQADRLHQLILDLLSLARIETGQQGFEIGPIPVGTMVDACLAQHATAAAAKHIELKSWPQNGAVQVTGDEEGLRQILDNLVDNALKYTPDGGRVTVRWGPQGEKVRIDVEDTGIGIPTQEQARIFERFYRVDKARSRELGGTGLGLSIVKHLVQAFGGSVSVTSEVGRGSTFSVWLPMH